MTEGNLFDIFQFARTSKVRSGTIDLSRMTTLAETLTGVAKAAKAEFTLKPTSGIKDLPAVELTLKAELTTDCVYCGEPCRIRIEKTLPFLLVKTEAEADKLPIEEDGDFDVIVGSTHFNLGALVEEEILLSLPAFPRHDACEGAMPEKAKDDAPESHNRPFSELGVLLKKKN